MMVNNIPPISTKRTTPLTLTHWKHLKTTTNRVRTSGPGLNHCSQQYRNQSG